MNKPRLFPFWRLAIVIFAVIAALIGGNAGAQDGSVDEVRIEVTRLGIGGLAREGSWTPMRVELNDRGLTSQRELVIRVRLRDPDGDEAEYDRVVTSNSGVTQAFWLYMKLPPLGVMPDWIDVLVYEAQESSDPRFGFRAGRLVGRTQVQTSRVLPAPRAIMGVVGANSFGLSAYGPTGRFESFLPFGHEITYLASGLEVSDLPDRWQGLESFDVLVWGATRDRYDPGRLSPDKARAIREWVEAGGHLVVVLPVVGQEWFSRTGNPLSELLPDILPPATLEGYDLNDLRPLLTSHKRDELPLPTASLVRTFTPSPDASVLDAIPILREPGGGCVVIRRILGSGAVTLVGIDFNQAALRNLGLPEAESFWHRVLGRRGMLMSAEEIQKKQNTGELNNLLQRSHIQLDVDLPEQIAMKGTAAFGVGLGVLVFVLYWIVAGPGVFYLLGRKSARQFAWVAFVGVVGVFTGVSWLGATAARPHRAMAKHITLLESVYGQPAHRARSWQGLLIPYYGNASVTIAQEDGAFPSRSLLSVFQTSSSMLSLSGFPDNRAYRIESRSPNMLAFPARSTVKELEVEWVGAGRWSMPEPVTEPGSLEQPGLRLALEGEFDADGKPLSCDVVGELVHGLPGPLEDAVILVNKGQITLTEGGRLKGNLFANVSAYELTDPWLADVRLDMTQATGHEANGSQSRQLAFQYLTALLRGERVSPGQGSRPDSRRLAERLKALALMPMLEPPSMIAGLGVESRLAKREMTHGFDLGLWFTQPSVMIIGLVRQSGRDVQSPVPLALDGQVVDAEGTTLVLWVYPLAADPPRVRMIQDERESGS